MTITEKIVNRWFSKHLEADPAEMLEHAAYYLTQQFTTTASFRDRGQLLPHQAQALNIVIRLSMEVQR